MAGKDVLALTPPERPHCVYEMEEYESLLATLTKEAPLGGIGFQPMENEPTTSPPSEKTSPHPHGLEAHATETLRVSAPPRDPTFIESNIALFQVLLSRAQAALGVARLTDDTRARTLNYQMHSTKIAALVQAQLHIARELRHWLKLLPIVDTWRGLRSVKTPGPSPKPKNPKPQGLPMQMMELLEETDGTLEKVLGIPYGDTPFKPRFNKQPPQNPSPA